MDRDDFVRRLRRAYARGAAWNWVYWHAEIRQGDLAVLVARVSARYVQAIERGDLTPPQAARAIATGLMPSLERSEPYVDLWEQAVQLLLIVREDAHRAKGYGRAATDLALEGSYKAAYDACLAAAAIEQRYAGKPMYWRPLLSLLDRAASGRLFR